MQWFMDQYFTFYHVAVALFALAGMFFLRKIFSAKENSREKPIQISFRKLNHRFDPELQELTILSQDPKKWFSKFKKHAHGSKKIESVEVPKKDVLEHRVYVLSFVGDIMARATDHLREEISLLLQIATPHDEIVIRLTSPGGSVAQYGFASSQIARFRHAQIPVTVCVDIIAASGGYMMAAVANKIVAAPFAFVGSIGVVAAIPNIHKVLQKHEIDYLLFTAGRYKRTITPFSEVTEEGKEKFQENIIEIHEAFQQHILGYRPKINMELVATGEHWLAQNAQEKGLIDEICTSDDYLASKMKTCHVIEVTSQSNRHRLSRWLNRGNAWFQSWKMTGGGIPFSTQPGPLDPSKSIW